MANATRQKYTVLVPFPTSDGHWSTIDQEIELLDVEAAAWLTAGRLKLNRDIQATPVTHQTPANTAAESKAE